MEAFRIEVVKLVGIFIAGSLSSGGVIMYFLHKNDRVNIHEKLIDRLSEGVQLLLESDIVIFKALREGHINGESEKQEEKIKEYFYRCTIRGIDVDRYKDKENS